MQEIHYAMGNMQIIRQELSRDFIIVENITKYLVDLPASQPFIQFLGYTKDKTQIMIVFNIKTWSLVSIFPFLGK